MVTRSAAPGACPGACPGTRQRATGSWWWGWGLTFGSSTGNIRNSGETPLLNESRSLLIFFESEIEPSPAPRAPTRLLPTHSGRAERGRWAPVEEVWEEEEEEEDDEDED